VRAGNILVRQVGEKHHRGAQRGVGRDFSLFALCDGVVKYHWKSRTKKQVSVLPS